MTRFFGGRSTPDRANRRQRRGDLLVRARTTDSIPGDLTALPCLGFLSGSLSPHYDSEAQRRPIYHRLIGGGDIPAGYAFEDGVAGHFVDGVLKGVVSSRPNAKGYYVEQVDGHAQETVLGTLYLG